MGKRSTFRGYLRTTGIDLVSKRPSPTPGVMPAVIAFTADFAAAAGTGTGKFLPKGAIPLRIDINSAHTGGSSPLADIGLELSTPNDDALVDGLAADADASVDIATTEAGVAMGVEQTETAEITAGTGGGTAGTGTAECYLWYVMADDGDIQD